MRLMRYQERWDPLRDLEQLTGRFNRMIAFPPTPFTGEHESLALTDWVPTCNISETTTEYRVRAELPGVKREDVHVSLEDGVLTLRGERKEELEEKGLTVHRRESLTGHFLRRFTMPDDVDTRKVTAGFKDGILHVTVAKMPAKTTSPREIAIG